MSASLSSLKQFAIERNAIQDKSEMAKSTQKVTEDPIAEHKAFETKEREESSPLGVSEESNLATKFERLHEALSMGNDSSDPIFEIITDKDVEDHLTNDSVIELDLTSCKKLTPQVGKAIAKCKTLETFEMYGGFTEQTYDISWDSEKLKAERDHRDLDDELALNIAESSTITDLGLQQTQICDKTVKTLLFKMPQLKRLDLANCFYITKETQQEIINTMKDRDGSCNVNINSGQWSRR